MPAQHVAKSIKEGEVYWTEFDFLESFMQDAFQRIGVPEEDAKTCADILIQADKRGVDSHGVGRFKTIYYDRIVHQKIQQAVTEFEIVKDFAATAVVDGHHGMGMPISKRCMQMAIDKARQYGVGVVVTRNSTHYGYAAAYPLMAVEQGMIGLTATNARPSIPPTHGVENMLGTNPMCFGFPTDDGIPFTNDYATSIIQRGRIEKYARDGVAVPPGLVIGPDGSYLTDPADILKKLVSGEAACCPIGGSGEETGGYKGYGFATVVEVLSASLQQGAFLKALTNLDTEGNLKPYALGHFFMAIDISKFCDVELFKKTTGDIMRELRNSKKAPGADRIYTCGEKEIDATHEREGKGAPIGRVLQQQLSEVKKDLGMDDYVFPWEE
ncbi:Ldh family oxidoreductase [Carpediemonas membranifera]|uniref:Ldh family oxidoreductase n=1 Tax=Carpediemonas membranifera TaxID=201153 RepID=A0A8J6E1E4_9EUKA|nr:Ldh family oxidoreductase [Carpediemonas membranifera]|eukprot:KAG9393368.1 Ldh family oxidoreductase [Carpediemonas membranifera]